MAADPGPLRWAWSKTAAPADNLDLIKYDDAGAVGTTAITVVRADSAATFAGAVTAPAVNIGANPVIADPQAGNALVFGATGLFVPASATFVPTVVVAGNGVSSAEAPVGTWTVGLVLDPAAGNTLSLSAAGLLSTATATVVVGGAGVSATEAPTGTYTLAVVPDPVAGNMATVSATGVAVLPSALPISADPGNLLELRADGLYVRAVGLVFGMP